MGVRLEGAERLSRALKRLGPENVQAIEGALDKGAEEVATRARSIVPKQTGELANAIEVRSSLDGLNLSGILARQAGKQDRLSRFVGIFPESRGSPGWYGLFVEFGTSKAPARPYLLPAFYSLKKRVTGRVKRAINKASRAVASSRG